MKTKIILPALSFAAGAALGAVGMHLQMSTPSPTLLSNRTELINTILGKIKVSKHSDFLNRLAYFSDTQTKGVYDFIMLNESSPAQAQALFEGMQDTPERNILNLILNA
jgi:hypothetical protein